MWSGDCAIKSTTVVGAGVGAGVIIDGGINIASITWTTPLFTILSGPVTVASLIITPVILRFSPWSVGTGVLL